MLRASASNDLLDSNLHHHRTPSSAPSHTCTYAHKQLNITHRFSELVTAIGSSSSLVLFMRETGSERHYTVNH